MMTNFPISVDELKALSVFRRDRQKPFTPAELDKLLTLGERAHGWLKDFGLVANQTVPTTEPAA